MSTPKPVTVKQPPKPEATDTPPKDSAESDSATTAVEVGTPPLDLVNPGTTSLNYDIVGHQIDAGGRVRVDSVDKVGKRLVRNEHLLCQDSAGAWITFDNKGAPVARPVADGASQPK